MKQAYTLIFIFFIISACKHKAQPVEVMTMNDTRPIKELKELVLSKGDTVAYDELSIAYLNEEFGEEYLLYSLVMANKYHYPHAYYHVFACLISVYENNNIAIDNETVELAICYIKKGAELKEGNSLAFLSDLYNEGKYVDRDTILGNKLAKEAHKIRGF